VDHEQKIPVHTELSSTEVEHMHNVGEQPIMMESPDLPTALAVETATSNSHYASSRPYFPFSSFTRVAEPKNPIDRAPNLSDLAYIDQIRTSTEDRETRLADLKARRAQLANQRADMEALMRLREEEERIGKEIAEIEAQVPTAELETNTPMPRLT
jgi:hypothetical protein